MDEIQQTAELRRISAEIWKHLAIASVDLRVEVRGGMRSVIDVAG